MQAKVFFVVPFLICNWSELRLNKVSSAFCNKSDATYADSNGGIVPVGEMQTPRAVHTATVLQNGEVLVVGGFDGGTLSSAEIYNPVSKRFRYVGSLSAARAGHTA